MRNSRTIRNSMWLVHAFVLLGLLLIGANARAVVVINEIFYHAPNDLDDLQWIELYNTADEPVDLSGWKFGKNPGYTFPAQTSIAGKGFIVVARNPARFRESYPGIKALGPFERDLSRSGERIDLFDAAGKRIDRAAYQDRVPWPVSADGYSASLERICPTYRGDVSQNWAASTMPTDAPKPAGTPGKVNAAYSAEMPPFIGEVRLTPDDPPPDQPLVVEADVKNKKDLRGVTLRYRIVSAGVEGPEKSVVMSLDDDGRFVATIPAQKANTLVRYRVAAMSESGVRRLYPSATDLAPALSAYVHNKWEPAKIPFGLILHVHSAGKPNVVSNGFRQFFGGNRGSGSADELPARPRGAPSQPHPPRGSSAFVYVDPRNGQTRLFDFVNVVPRDNDRGFKVHFHKDHTLNGMSVVSLIFEGDERFLLAEYLAYDVYRRAGNAASQSEFIRVWIDGRLVGYHLLIEQPNKSFLRRNNVRDDGNLYKLIWYGGGVVGQHEKRTYPQTGHDDLVAIIDRLQKTTGEAQWKVIQDNFAVNQVATYFAVNTVLSHWDGFFNNYFTYHDVRGTKKWTMYPWDQDKTWGHHDGLSDTQIFFDMPLTYGMEGDIAPGGQTGGFFGGGNVMWWRRGGYFSRPLLANPQFRKVFLARTKEILAKVYTKEIYFPIMDDLADRLKEDVKLRAKLTYGDPAGGVTRLQENLESLRTHLVKRREFLLEQDELKDLP